MKNTKYYEITNRTVHYSILLRYCIVRWLKKRNTWYYDLFGHFGTLWTDCESICKSGQKFRTWIRYPLGSLWFYTLKKWTARCLGSNTANIVNMSRLETNYCAEKINDQNNISSVFLIYVHLGFLTSWSPIITIIWYKLCTYVLTYDRAPCPNRSYLRQCMVLRTYVRCPIPVINIKFHFLFSQDRVFVYSY